jgi:hypothetical protein
MIFNYYVLDYGCSVPHCTLLIDPHNFQDDTAFEKQSALFALAVSDIVLINM